MAKRRINRLIKRPLRGGIIPDILLLVMVWSCLEPGLDIGTHLWVRCQISKPLRTQFGLGMAFLALLGLAWLYLQPSMVQLG